MSKKVVFLVVSDCNFDGVLTQRLRSLNYEVVRFETVKEIGDSIKLSPDAIIVDYDKEGKAGLEFLKKAKITSRTVLIVLGKHSCTNLYIHQAYHYLIKEKSIEKTLSVLISKISSLKKVHNGFLETFRQRVFALYNF
jgi:DNA-binding NtrC family response regulator